MKSHARAPHRITTRINPLYLALSVAGLTLLSQQVQAQEASAIKLADITVNAASDKVKLAEKVSAGALGARSELETPFSTKSVSGEEIEARQATGLAEVLKYDASVTNSSPSVGTHPATLSMRGLKLDDLNSYKVDGLANVNRGTELPLEMFDSVEALKGLSGFMYGFGSPGGIVNYVSKRPLTDAFFSADMGVVTGGALKEHIDTGTRFGDNARYGWRLNLVNEQGGVAQEDGSVHRNALGLSLDAKLTRDLTATYDMIHQQRETAGGTDIITSTSYVIPKAIKGSTRLYSDGAYSNVDFSMSTLGLSYQIAPDWKAGLSYRESDSVRTYKKDQYYIQNNSGYARDRVTAEYHGYDFRQWQGQVEGKLMTGSIKHELVAGLSDQTLLSTSSVTTPKTYVGYSYVSAPTILSANAVKYSGGKYEDDRVGQTAAFASDTIAWTDSWSTLLGLRDTSFRDTTFTTAGKESAHYAAHPVTPTLSVMYKVQPTTTVYVSRVEALEQAATADSTTANYGQTFAPLRSKQNELGIKTAQDIWSGSASVFRITRSAQYTNSANYYVADGQTVYKGVELNGSVQTTSRLTFSGSLMWLNAKLTDTTAAYVGKRAVGAPDKQAGAEVSYQIPGVPGLTVRAGATYTGQVAVDAANVHTLSSYTLLDTGLRYVTRVYGRQTTVSFNVSNVGDHAYWSLYEENKLNLGNARSAALNVKVDF